MPKISYLLLEKKRYLWFYPKAQIFIIEKYKNQIIYMKYPQLNNPGFVSCLKTK